MKGYKRIYLIGNAHIDPVWLWRWQDGFAEVRATFRSALDRMIEFEDFVFTCAGACYYRWIEESDPDMFAEIKERVAEGRWVIAGGLWIQPDMNIPSGESFARHILYSQRYYLEKFNKTAEFGYNVDSFGHNGMFPGILKKGNMNYYVFMRPGSHEKELPGNLFFWEGIDGSKVLTFKIPISYTTGFNKEGFIEKKIEAYEKEGVTPDEVMLFYGVGNHGGGPTIGNIKEALMLMEKKGRDHIFFSSPREYFKSIEKNDTQDIPVVRDDLQHHASGCYSAHSATKKYNRMCEERLVSAEAFMTISSLIAGFEDRGDKIKQAWEKVMFNQFHDIMCGCSIKDAYDESSESFGYALTSGAEILNGAIQKISANIDTSKGMDNIRLNKDKDNILWEEDQRGVPMVIFNPLSRKVKVPVTVNRKMSAVCDFNDEPVDFQIIRAKRSNTIDDMHDTLFLAEVPALGYSTYWIYKDRVFDFKTEDKILTEDNVLENDFIKLVLNKETGLIKELTCKSNYVNILAGEASIPLVIDETDSDTWSHGIFSFRKEVGRFKLDHMEKIESGILREIIRVFFRYNDSYLRLDYILYNGSHKVEVDAKVNWHEEHKMLKLSFPLRGKGHKACYEISSGFIKRPLNGEEEPGRRWVDLSSDEGGLAVLNDCKYSFDILNNDLRMTVLRSPAYADHYGIRDGMYEIMDQGIQYFRFALLPHSQEMEYYNITNEAEQFNAVFPGIKETYHKGFLDLSYSGIKVDSEKIFAGVFKKAESGNELIIRCYEQSGERVKTKIDINSVDVCFTAEFGPFEIKTFKINRFSKKVREVYLFEQ